MKKGQGRSGFSNLLSQMVDYLPQFCCFCHRKTATQRDLCEYCESHLPRIGEKSSKNGSTLCLRCGIEWPYPNERQQCAECANYQTRVSRIVSPFRYDFPIDFLIGRLKYKQHLQTGRLLGSLMAQQARKSLIDANNYPDFLLPVPLSHERYCDRGFNHAAEIANSCGAELGIPVLPYVAGRHFDIGALAGLSRAERSMKIRGAFWVSDDVRSSRVAIVDDVLTTGATSGELATELVDSGVNDVQLWVVARTPARDNYGAS